MEIVVRLAKTGLRRGMRGSRPWLYVGLVASGVRIVRWLARERPVTIYQAVLEPGERLEVTTRAPGT